MYYRKFFCRFHEIFTQIIKSPANKDRFIPSFLACMTFFSLTLLYWLVSSTVSNKSSENGHTCFVPDLSGKALSFNVKYAVNCRFFVDALYQFEKVFIYSWFPRFYHERRLDFVKCFLFIYWDDQMVFQHEEWYWLIFKC